MEIKIKVEKMLLALQESSIITNEVMHTHYNEYGHATIFMSADDEGTGPTTITLIGLTNLITVDFENDNRTMFSTIDFDRSVKQAINDISERITKALLETPEQRIDSTVEGLKRKILWDIMSSSKLSSEKVKRLMDLEYMSMCTDSHNEDGYEPRFQVNYELSVEQLKDLISILNEPILNIKKENKNEWRKQIKRINKDYRYNN